MFKNSVGFLLSFLLFLGTISFSQSVEAKSSKRTPHAKMKKKAIKKNHKRPMKMAKVKAKSKKHAKVVAKKHKHEPINRKIASIKAKKAHHGMKVKRRKSNLPKEYGTIQ